MTIWQAEESFALFSTMQATVRPRSGMVCKQTRKASFMQRFCSSALCAMAAVESIAKATLRMMRFMEVPLARGLAARPPGQVNAPLQWVRRGEEPKGSKVEKN